ncbi:MAG: hypothetical protein ACE5F1_01265 [Planctomycetota bacterium]
MQLELNALFWRHTSRSGLEAGPVVSTRFTWRLGRAKKRWIRAELEAIF